MKVTNINSQYTSTNIVTSADVNLRNVDAKFLFHSIRRIQMLWDTVFGSDNEEQKEKAIQEIHKLTMKQYYLLLPIAEQILVPVEDVNQFLEEFDTTEDRSEIDIRKSKHKKTGYDEVSPN